MRTRLPLCLVLGALLIVPAFVGCNDDDDDNGNGGNGTAALQGTWMDLAGATWTISGSTYAYERTAGIVSFVAGGTGNPDIIQGFQGADWESTTPDGNGQLDVGEVFVSQVNSNHSIRVLSSTRLGLRESHPTNSNIYDEHHADWELDGTTLTLYDAHAGSYSIADGRIEFTPDQPSQVAGVEIDGSELITMGFTMSSANAAPTSLIDGSPWTSVSVENGNYVHMRLDVTAEHVEFNVWFGEDSDPQAYGMAGFSELFTWQQSGNEVQLHAVTRRDFEIDDDTLTMWNVEGDIGSWTNVTYDFDEEMYVVFVGSYGGGNQDVGEAFASVDDDLVGNDWASMFGVLKFFADGRYVVEDNFENVQDRGRWQQVTAERIYWSSLGEYYRQ